MGWRSPDDTGITSERLILTALVPDDADALVDVLADPRLHEFIGGEPASLTELRDRFERMVAGPSSDDERWLNWVVRRRLGGEPVGTVQATLAGTGGAWSAEVAWVIGVGWQGHGYASEAARALVGWLQQRGVDRVTANIHPEHDASAAVARHAGLRPTSGEVDGEQVWELDR